ncbi:MAG: hypothetical protein L6Q97_09420, partial [Thermoanaerobaculia bacterium]|nr:hypothetical protein [Thermoanaerobaculia bacterium]
MQNLTFIKRPIFSFLLFATLIATFSSCQKESLTEIPQTTSNVVTDRSNGTIVDIAVSNPDFSTLVAAVVKTGLVE